MAQCVLPFKYELEKKTTGMTATGKLAGVLGFVQSDWFK